MCVIASISVEALWLDMYLIHCLDEQAHAALRTEINLQGQWLSLMQWKIRDKKKEMFFFSSPSPFLMVFRRLCYHAEYGQVEM